VLSAITHSESACIESFSSLEAKDFSEPLHQELFNLALSIFSDGHNPSAAIMMREGSKLGYLDSKEKLEEVNYALSAFVDDDTRYWIDKVSDSSKKREFAKIIQRHQEPPDNIDEALGQTIADLSMISAGKNKNDFEDGKVIADKLEKILDEKVSKFEEARLTGNQVMDGLPTGFEKLDKITLGYKPGDLIVLAAQTGHGKSAFALQTAKRITIDKAYNLLYINTEMSDESVYMRFASVITGIPFYDIQQGNIGKPEDQVKRSAALKAIRRSGFVHKYSPNLTPAQCIMDARRAKFQKNIDMIIIDYIGRMDKIDPKLQEWQVLEQIVKTQKILAQELKIPIMILCQLNTTDGTLQGTKRIKNESDLMMKLCPIAREEQEDYRQYTNANYRLYVDKNRNGESGFNIPVHYDMPVQRLEQATLGSPTADYNGIAREVKGKEKQRYGR